MRMDFPCVVWRSFEETLSAGCRRRVSSASEEADVRLARSKVFVVSTIPCEAKAVASNLPVVRSLDFRVSDKLGFVCQDGHPSGMARLIYWVTFVEDEASFLGKE